MDPKMMVWKRNVLSTLGDFGVQPLVFEGASTLEMNDFSPKKPSKTPKKEAVRLPNIIFEGRQMLVFWGMYFSNWLGYPFSCAMPTPPTEKKT